MNPEVVAAFGDVVFLMTPIIFILTRHQQTMAKIIRETHAQPDQDVRRELEQLRQIVVQKTLALDSLAEEHRKLLARPTSIVDQHTHA